MRTADTASPISDAAATAPLKLAPLIESTFRASYILVQKVREEMLDAGEDEALESLIADARERQDELLGSSD